MLDIETRDLRAHSRDALELLEAWLRRLIHHVLSTKYGADYLDATDQSGNRVVKMDTVKDVRKRIEAEAGRYSREVDALHLEQALDIVCRESLWRAHFRPALEPAFSGNRDSTRAMLQRLVDPRHRLSHQNPVSHHDCLRLLCYSRDVVAAITEYFQTVSGTMEFNAPFFSVARDSLGHEWHFAQPGTGSVGNHKLPIASLRPGDVLRLEVEVDAAFSPDSYSVTFGYYHAVDGHSSCQEPVVNIDIADCHIGETFKARAVVKSNKSWHRKGGHDDALTFWYRVLPPPN